MKYLVIRALAVLSASYITGVGVSLVFTTLKLSFSTAWVALLTALTLAIINHTIKPLFMLVSIPVNIATLGLFSFVINGAMILLASKIVNGFDVPSLLMAIYFSIVLTIVNWGLHHFE
jgi:putative membrane protein